MPAAKIFTEHYTRFQTKLVHKFYRRHMENIPDSPEGVLLESLLEGMNQYYSEECFYGHNISIKTTTSSGGMH